jgi:hypothetical protein
MEDPSRLKHISHEQRSVISSQSRIHEERRAKGETHGGEMMHVVEAHHGEGDMHKKMKEMEHELKEAMGKRGGHLSEHEAGV